MTLLLSDKLFFTNHFDRLLRQINNFFIEYTLPIHTSFIFTNANQHSLHCKFQFFAFTHHSSPFLWKAIQHTKDMLWKYITTLTNNGDLHTVEGDMNLRLTAMRQYDDVF
jgi:hypothetical protein